MMRWTHTRTGLALVAAAAVVSTTLTPAASQQQRPLRYGNTSGWSFDMRDDDRDSPSNGFFPGNFAAFPPAASIGAAGWLESNPRRSAAPYPSQVVFGAPAGERSVHRQRSETNHRHVSRSGTSRP
jgi:hypothetical protein